MPRSSMAVIQAQVWLSLKPVLLTTEPPSLLEAQHCLYICLFKAGFASEFCLELAFRGPSGTPTKMLPEPVLQRAAPSTTQARHKQASDGRGVHSTPCHATFAL